MTTHGDLALENFKHAESAPSNAWRVTMYFYAGVHAVNHAIFGSKRYAPPTYRHDDRRTWVRQKWSLVDQTTYKDLEEASRIARYYAADHPVDEQLVRDAKQGCADVLKTAGLTIPAPPAQPPPAPVPAPAQN